MTKQRNPWNWRGNQKPIKKEEPVKTEPSPEPEAEKQEPVKKKAGRPKKKKADDE